MKFLLSSISALVFCITLSVPSIGFSLHKPQENKLTQQEKKAQQLWNSFIKDRTFRWADYVNKLAVILKGQKKYEQFVTLLKKHKASKLRELGKDLERELTRRNLEDLEDLEEIEILWQPEDNANLDKYYGTPYGALPFLLCERMDGKTKKQCFNLIGAGVKRRH